MKISIGNDHAGPEYKKAIVQYLESKGHQITNHGTDTFDSVDYPDFGHKVAIDVNDKNADFGILICGSGNGIELASAPNRRTRGRGLRKKVQHRTRPTTRVGFAAAIAIASGPENDSPTNTKGPSGGMASYATASR